MSSNSSRSNSSDDEEPSSEKNAPAGGSSEKSVNLETIIQLNEHAKRLLSALYNLLGQLKKQEYADLLQPIKVDKKKPFTLSKDRAIEVGQLLRYPFAVLQHVKQFQSCAYTALLNSINESKDLDIGWNYVFAKPILELFANYVKVHIFLLYLPDLKSFFIYYKAANEKILKSSDPNLGPLLDFLTARSSLKQVEAELQCFSDHFFTLFKSIIPSLQLLLGSAQTFPWKLFNLLDKPEPSLVNETFFKVKYLAMMHLCDLCDYFIIYSLVFMQVCAQDSVFMEMFSVIVNHQLVLNLAGQLNIDIKDLLARFKKVKDKRVDFNSSAIENMESNFITQRENTCYKQRKLSMCLRQFDAATEIDASLICSKYPILLGMLGFANYELKCAFRVKTAKPNIPPFDNEISELLYFYAKLTTKMLRSIPDLQRFFIYNLHEFDANYLDTLIHSFTIPTVQYQKAEQLIVALRTLNIEEFDNGKQYDLHAAISVIRNICCGFNQYATTHGITHMTPLMYLISGVYFRLLASQDPFNLICEISQIHTYWSHIDSLDAILSDFNAVNSRFSAVLLSMVHYYQFDLPAIAEIPGIKVKIGEHYETSMKNVCRIIYTSFKNLQEECYLSFRDQMSIKNVLSSKIDVAGEESTTNNRRNHKLTYRLIKKITRMLSITHRTGFITVNEVEHNVHQEVMDKALQGIKNLFKDDSSPPIAFFRKFQTAKWAFQFICNAGCVNFQSVLFDSIEQMTIVDTKIGPVAKNFKTKYSELATTELKSCYYSNTQEMFISKNPIVYEYLSIPAISALQKIIGKVGCSRIYKNLGGIFAGILKNFAGAVSKLIYSDAEIVKQGLCTSPEGDELVRTWCHMAAILQLRRMIQPYTDQPYVLPHNDKGLMKGVEDAGALKLYDDPKFISVLGSLFTVPYWSNSEYIVVHDAMNDNSHLMGRVLDVILGAGLASKKIKSPEQFYNEFFNRMLLGIKVGIKQYANNKKVNYPGMKLLIISDHIIRTSEYADYASIESIVSYQYIRSVYTYELSKYVENKKQQQAEKEANLKEAKKKDSKKKDSKKKETPASPPASPAPQSSETAASEEKEAEKEDAPAASEEESPKKKDKDKKKKKSHHSKKDKK